MDEWLRGYEELLRRQSEQGLQGDEVRAQRAAYFDTRPSLFGSPSPASQSPAASLFAPPGNAPPIPFSMPEPARSPVEAAPPPAQVHSPPPSFAAPEPSPAPAEAFQLPNVFTEPAPLAPPPSSTFLDQARTNIAPPPSPATFTPAGQAPAPMPLVSAPSAGLLRALSYSPAPQMPGYGQARSGSPFRAPQGTAPLASLFDMIAANQQLGRQPATPGSGMFGFDFR